jgi:hypothetical protein
MLRFEARGLRVNYALPSRLLLLSFLLPFTWGRHRRARATTALPGASSLYTCSSMVLSTNYNNSHYGEMNDTTRRTPRNIVRLSVQTWCPHHAEMAGWIVLKIGGNTQEEREREEREKKS